MANYTPDPRGTEPWDEFREKVAQMTKAGEINDVWLALLRNPTVMRVHRLARIALLRARWKELFGDAMFVVDDEV